MGLILYLKYVELSLINSTGSGCARQFTERYSAEMMLAEGEMFGWEMDGCLVRLWLTTIFLLLHNCV